MRGGGRFRGVAAGICILIVTPEVGNAAEPAVRVLLDERRGPVQLVSEGSWGAAPRRIEALAAGVRVDGEGIRPRLRLEGPGPHSVDGRAYRGALEVRSQGGRAVIINEVPIEAYVAGMLLGEVYGGWGEAVLQAQAVAGRTYALHRRERARGRAFDLQAGTSGQVYLGVRGETPASWAAVEATRGELLVWDGAPILAAFHSSSGGRTASAAEVWGDAIPYLRSVEVEGEEDSPDAYWRASVSESRLEQVFAQLGKPLGRIQALRVVARSPSGRALRVAARGTHGRAELEGRALRRALGLSTVKSTLFEVRREGDGFVLVGSGRGHGVGLSQWGARAMARRGAGYREILAHFYPGAALTRLEGGASPGHDERSARLAEERR